MKKIILIMFVLCASLYGAVAQDAKHAKTPEERAELVTQKMHKHLNFSTDQMAKVKIINLNKAKQLDVLRAKKKANSIDGKAFMQERKSINQARENEILVLLSADQKVKYAEMKQKMEEKAKQRRAEHKEHKKSLNSEEEDID